MIRDKYNQMNGPNSFLLFPKSNELTNPNNTGKRSEFLGGNIYWSTSTGAHPVAHDFLTKWGQYGYEGGFMKYPTTDEILFSDGGRRQEFQGAFIYFSFATGAHNVQGLIEDRYLALGGPLGSLGYPVADEETVPRSSSLYGQYQKRSRFQNGSLYYQSGTNKIFKTKIVYRYGN